MKQYRSLLDRTFKDSSGKIVIGQYPNALLWAFLLFGTLSSFLDGNLSEVLRQTSKAALVAWAVLEIVSGVNYFRRICGCVVMGLILYSYF